MATENDEHIDEKMALKAADGDYHNDDATFKKSNGDASTELKVNFIEPPKKAFTGLTKDELAKFANDPYWIKVRWIMLIVFWLVWLGMLVAAVIIIILAPKCPHRPDQKWYQKDVFYQVLPQSFKDTNGDGIGDLKGIKDNLDYVKKTLNANALWINSFYESDDIFLDYNIINQTEIDKNFGSLDDFKALRHEIHKRGMKLVLDFVPNHTSNKSVWFEKSIQKIDPYTDYYVWRTQKPSNWLNQYDKDAWTYDGDRKQYYYHRYLKEQPDLNLWNPEVQKELLKILQYWLALGVDGFVVQGAPYLFEESETQNGETTPDYRANPGSPATFHPKNYWLVSQWRAELDKYSESTPDKYRVLLVASEGTSNQTKSFYEMTDNKGARLKGAHLVVHNNFAIVNSSCNGFCVDNIVKDWLVPGAAWISGSSNYGRLATRVGDKFVNAFNMLLLTIPGVPLTYYGEELGMRDGNFDLKQTRDVVALELKDVKFSKDPQRTPMQWDHSVSSGFSNSSNTWLPVNSDYNNRNKMQQTAHGSGYTNAEVYAMLTKLRESPSFLWGDLKYVHRSDSIFSYARQAEGFPGFLVAINFGPNSETVDYHKGESDLVPKMAKLVASTANFEVDREKDFIVGNQIPVTGVFLNPGEGVVVEWGWKAAETEKQHEQ